MNKYKHTINGIRFNYHNGNFQFEDGVSENDALNIVDIILSNVSIRVGKKINDVSDKIIDDHIYSNSIKSTKGLIDPKI